MEAVPISLMEDLRTKENIFPGSIESLSYPRMIACLVTNVSVFVRMEVTIALWDEAMRLSP